MALAIQLSLLDANDEFSLLCREDTKLDTKIENYRKSTFAANEHLVKCLEELQAENKQMKKFLMQKCGATLADLTPELTVCARKTRKKNKIHALHPSFPGFS